MRNILAILFASFVLFSNVGYAGFFFTSDSRISTVTTYHTTVGTTTAAAIASGSIASSIYSFQICNDAVNTSTYLAVGITADVSTDGIRLDKGQCFVCENCKSAVLSTLKVEGEAADNGYSVIMYSN